MNAGAWLTCFPVCEALRFTDEEFGYAVRHRLGLSYSDGLPPQCACGEDLEADPSHFHACPPLRGSVVRIRHDQVVKILAQLFRQVGAVVHVEPRIYGSARIRPDLDITLPDRSLMVDVCIGHPAAQSRTSVVPRATLEAAEKIKFDRYADLAKRYGAEFIPFALETYGTFSSNASRLLKILKAASGAYSAPIPASSLGSYAVQVLSAGLQRGNALICKKGCIEARAAATGQGE